MTYRAPTADILNAMMAAAGTSASTTDDALSDGTAAAVIDEAGRLAADLLVPLDRVGDRTGIGFADRSVTAAPGWAEAYRRWIEGGWNGVAAPEAYGGQGLSRLVQAACTEIWSAANLSFGLCPLLTASAIEAVATHGSDELKRLYLGKLVSGEWTGTMNLTEPQAGSDLGTLRTRAEPRPDGSYAITGAKIYITYGDHDMTDNIVHLVLARLPDAAPGTRGISLFLVPKFMVGTDGTLGTRNGVYCTGIERKLGMHAAPTCSMSFGDGAEAVGYLVGEAGRGLNAMFTMMNQARLAVGLEGVGAAERATQLALRYAGERRQGRAPADAAGGASPIIRHPDVARMLMTMKALTGAARAICYLTAQALDEAERLPDAAGRTAAAERAALLTPVAKAFATDSAVEVASLGIQVHGGMGYIEETGAAQILRDVRITPIYEGTNGIQAIDLVGRKVTADGGRVFRRELQAMRDVTRSVAQRNDPAFGETAPRLDATLDALEEATAFLLEYMEKDRAGTLAGASAYLQLFGLARGGTALAAGAMLGGAEDAPASAARIAVARFFAERLAAAAPGLVQSITEGGIDVANWQAALAASA